MKKILAVDFDGTVVIHAYPSIGEDIPGCVDVLKKLTKAGVRIILWTMRHGKELEDAVRWFEDKEIPLFGINQNPEQLSWTQSPKCYAQIYVDDAALGCPLVYPENGDRPYVDWFAVEKLLHDKMFCWDDFYIAEQEEL